MEPEKGSSEEAMDVGDTDAGKRQRAEGTPSIRDSSSSSSSSYSSSSSSEDDPPVEDQKKKKTETEKGNVKSEKKTEMLYDVYMKSSVSFSFIYFCFVSFLIFQTCTADVFVYHAFVQI